MPTPRVDFDWTNKVGFAFGVSSTADDGSAIDYSAATQIVCEIKENGCRRLYASLADGSITVANPEVFEVSFTRDQMKTLCPGSYDIGAVFETADGDGQAFRGTLTITDGIADLS